MFTSQKPVVVSDKAVSKTANNEIAVAADLIKDYEAEQFALIQAQYEHCIKCLIKVEDNANVRVLRFDAQKSKQDSSYVPDREILSLAVNAIYERFILIILARSMRYDAFSLLCNVCKECAEVLNDKKPDNELVILDKVKQLASQLDEAEINLLERLHERRKIVIEDCLSKLANYHPHEIKMKITT